MKWVRQKHNVQVIEAYQDFEPSLDAKKVVQRLLVGIPERYLHSLRSVILTNGSGLSREGRREKTTSRGHSVKISEARGLYQRAWQGQPAHVKLFVDSILLPWEIKNANIGVPSILKAIRRLWNRTSFSIDFLFAQVLYHEIGHHIHQTQAPQHRERENVAEVWNQRLMKHYFFRKYWYMYPISIFTARIYMPLARIYRPLKDFVRRTK